MTNITKYDHLKTSVSAAMLLYLLLALYCTRSFAQQPPPFPFAVYTNPAQGLMFGAFTQGIVGGSIIVFANGSRSSTGDVIPLGLGYPFAPAIIEVEAPAGTRLAILNGPDATLTGSNGGSMTLHIDGSDVGDHFVATQIPPARTQVRIGGTLNVGTPLANPRGTYSGMFFVTFVQE